MIYTKSQYKSFLTKLDEKYKKLRNDADKSYNNKTASLRVRKLSLSFRDDLKDLRKILLDLNKVKIMKS